LSDPVGPLKEITIVEVFIDMYILRCVFVLSYVMTIYLNFTLLKLYLFNVRLVNLDESTTVCVNN